MALLVLQNDVETKPTHLGFYPQKLFLIILIVKTLKMLFTKSSHYVVTFMLNSFSCHLTK